MASKGNIGVFQAYHTLQVHTLNLVRGLRESGYSVDLFLFRTTSQAQSIDRQDRQIIDLSDVTEYWKSQRNKLRRVLAILKWSIIDPLSPDPRDMISKKVFDLSLELVKRNNYLCFIGVEKLGLAWASMISEHTQTPVLYYSLELYQNGYFSSLSMGKWLRFLKTRLLEMRYHRRAVATIVQDKNRAEILDQMNGTRDVPRLYLPVSTWDDGVPEHTNFLRDQLGIPNGMKVILQFGLLNRKRLTDQIALASQDFPEDWVLVLHGLPDERHIVERIKEIDEKGRIIVSTKLVSSKLIDVLIGSADIGLCFYDSKNMNDYHTGFSSEKLARHLRMGIPVVAFDYPSFRESVEKTGCGICINDLSHLVRAINQINGDYNKFRMKALQTYKKYFRFQDQFPNVERFIGNLI